MQYSVGSEIRRKNQKYCSFVFIFSRTVCVCGRDGSGGCFVCKGSVDMNYKLYIFVTLSIFCPLSWDLVFKLQICFSG